LFKYINKTFSILSKQKKKGERNVEKGMWMIEGGKKEERRRKGKRVRTTRERERN
jgi:hypothetical protein